LIFSYARSAHDWTYLFLFCHGSPYSRHADCVRRRKRVAHCRARCDYEPGSADKRPANVRPVEHSGRPSRAQARPGNSDKRSGTHGDTDKYCNSNVDTNGHTFADEYSADQPAADEYSAVTHRRFTANADTPGGTHGLADLVCTSRSLCDRPGGGTARAQEQACAIFLSRQFSQYR
jgi:hypothetical protein